METGVLLAGATGNLGRALIPVFHARGWKVVALFRPGGERRLEPLSEHIERTVAAEVTQPDTPAEIFDGVQMVVSCVGITRQRDGLTYDQVDYGGNLNLLRAAEQCGVRRLVYVSVVGADRDVDVPVMRAKRRFEQALSESGLEWQIVRPSGFFTDMVDVWTMARKGTVHLFGDGESRISPIDPVDLAEAVADLLGDEPGTIREVGGPRDFTWNEIARLSFRVAGRTPKIRHWPRWSLRASLALTRPFSRQTYGALSFLGYVMTHDTTAPNHGSRSLEEFLRRYQEVEASVPLPTRFKRLNEDWNAEPNVPLPSVSLDGADVILEFALNHLLYPQFEKGQRARLRFHDCHLYRLGETNDEGWYMG